MNPLPHRSIPRNRRSRLPVRAFTLIEILIAIGIFMMVISAIYTTWTAILRGSHTATEVAANIQRGRIAVRALEDSLLTAVNFTSNVKYYTFLADTAGEYAALSFVARLPESFPGSGFNPNDAVRRISFTVEEGDHGANRLVMRQVPLLTDPDAGYEPQMLVLSQDVRKFLLEFYDAQRNEWLTEWTQTNALPRLVRVLLEQGTSRNKEATDVTIRTIALPAMAVPRELQLGAGGRRGNPGAVTPDDPNAIGDPNNPSVTPNPGGPGVPRRPRNILPGGPR